MPALLRRFLLAPVPRLVWTGILAWVLVRLMFWVAPTVMRASNVTLTGSIRNAVLTLVVFAAALWLFERKRPRDAGLGLAYLEDPRTGRITGYRVGDPLPGGRVERIERDRVLIRQGGELVEVLMNRSHTLAPTDRVPISSEPTASAVPWRRMPKD